MAAPLINKQFSCKDNGVGNEGCSLLGPLLPASLMPLCSAKSYELFPEDSSQLCQWLVFLLTVHLVLLLEISQLLLQLLYLGGPVVLVVGLLVVLCF